MFFYGGSRGSGVQIGEMSGMKANEQGAWKKSKIANSVLFGVIHRLYQGVLYF
jgi:hypothetical protein